jgi:hypothetical protein
MTVRSQGWASAVERLRPGKRSGAGTILTGRYNGKRAAESDGGSVGGLFAVKRRQCESVDFFASSDDTSRMAESENDLKEYRKLLIDNEQDAIDEFDKAIITLSGGALAISFAFIKDIVKPENMIAPRWLLAAWVSWGMSIIFVVAGYYFSHLAMSIAITQVDEGKIRNESRGRWANKLTLALNPIAGFAFILGLILMVVFVNKNFHYVNTTAATAAATVTTTTTTTTTTTEPASPPGGINSTVHTKP